MAAEPGAFSDPITWVNFGALGLVVLGLLTGWLWPKPASDRLTQERDRILEERDKAYAQRDAMAEVLQDRLLPVVAEFIVTTKALLPVLQEVQRLQHMVPVLQEFIDQANRGGPPNERGRR